MVELKNQIAEFTFNVKARNAKVSDTEARLVLEGKNGNITYPARINDAGEAIIEFTPSDILSEGKIHLEVINKDFYSKLWEDTYIFESQELTNVEKYYQKGLQKLKVTTVNENRKEKHINILLEHTAKRYTLDTSEMLKLKQNTSNLL